MGSSGCLAPRNATEYTEYTDLIRVPSRCGVALGHVPARCAAGSGPASVIRGVNSRFTLERNRGRDVQARP